MQQTKKQKSVKFITLGCKVNQYETQGMREILHQAGVVEEKSYQDEHDFVVINTCTVTEQADKENRYWIRRMRRENPEAKIVVTGCYVEKNRAEIEALKEVDLVLSNDEKADVVDHLVSGCATPEMQDLEIARKKRLSFTPLEISNFQGHARGFIKVQDGCNHACSFCKTVLVRGRSRSRLAVDVIEEAARLVAAGYREVVLTGIQLGAYGEDFNHKHALAELIGRLAEVSGVERIRLSSIEPTDVTDELIDKLKTIPQCCPHLHIPLQSGDDRVLQAMNRRYDRFFYENLIEKLKGEIPDFSLTMDVMAGFAGETDEQFENSMNLLSKVKPLKSHVFPYSQRAGTRAASFEGHLPIERIRERARRMIELTDEIGRLERLKYVDQVHGVLVEKKLKRGGLVQGLTPNYLKVCFQGDESWVGKIVPVELLSLEQDVFLGRLVKDRFLV